jgi:nicotinate-nucleotide--dimethylbenzimidazole phosphoribosyltransferase
VKHAFAPRPGLLARKIGWGTADALEGPAMTPAECIAAVETGAGVVRSLPGNVVLFGEMGIGNTSSASLLMARLTGEAIDRCTGRGTGVDGPALVRKTEILRKVLARHEAATAPLDVLAAFGGFEIAMLVGAVLEAAAQRRVIVVDGFIVSAAVLVAARLHPNVLQRCVFAHQSDESGHRLMLARLEAEPLLSLGLRLGEGSGAALAWPLLDSACRILAEMASFASAGVSDRAD